MRKRKHNSHRHRPGPQHLRWLYTLGLLLLLSGAGWLIARYALRSVSGPFGDVPHPSEPWWMRLHGAAALGFLVAFGALLPQHVAHNWRRRQHYRSGLVVVTAVGVLALTGYGLYYLVSDTLRPLTSTIHWVVGIFASGALVTHVVLSYRRTLHERALRTQRDDRIQASDEVTSS